MTREILYFTREISGNFKVGLLWQSIQTLFRWQCCDRVTNVEVPFWVTMLWQSDKCWSPFSGDNVVTVSNIEVPFWVTMLWQCQMLKSLFRWQCCDRVTNVAILFWVTMLWQSDKCWSPFLGDNVTEWQMLNFLFRWQCCHFYWVDNSCSILFG